MLARGAIFFRGLPLPDFRRFFLLLLKKTTRRQDECESIDVDGRRKVAELRPPDPRAAVDPQRMMA
jgi:hypothetical protein